MEQKKGENEVEVMEVEVYFNTWISKRTCK